MLSGACWETGSESKAQPQTTGKISKHQLISLWVALNERPRVGFTCKVDDPVGTFYTWSENCRKSRLERQNAGLNNETEALKDLQGISDRR